MCIFVSYMKLFLSSMKMFILVLLHRYFDILAYLWNFQNTLKSKITEEEEQVIFEEFDITRLILLYNKIPDNMKFFLGEMAKRN